MTHRVILTLQHLMGFNANAAVTFVEKDFIFFQGEGRASFHAKSKHDQSSRSVHACVRWDQHPPS